MAPTSPQQCSVRRDQSTMTGSVDRVTKPIGRDVDISGDVRTTNRPCRVQASGLASCAHGDRPVTSGGSTRIGWRDTRRNGDEPHGTTAPPRDDDDAELDGRAHPPAPARAPPGVAGGTPRRPSRSARASRPMAAVRSRATTGRGRSDRSVVSDPRQDTRDDPGARSNGAPRGRRRGRCPRAPKPLRCEPPRRTLPPRRARRNPPPATAITGGGKPGVRRPRPRCRRAHRW